MAKTTKITDPRHPLTQNGRYTVYGDHDFPKTRSIKSPKAVCRRCGLQRRILARQADFGMYGENLHLCMINNAPSDTEYYMGREEWAERMAAERAG